MTIETTSAPLVDATVLRQYLAEADLSQRSAARTLRIDERIMRRYCAGDLPAPPYVILSLMHLSQMRRNSRVVELLDSGELSTSDGPLTKERLLENNAKLRRANEFLLGRGTLEDEPGPAT